VDTVNRYENSADFAKMGYRAAECERAAFPLFNCSTVQLFNSTAERVGAFAAIGIRWKLLSASRAGKSEKIR
jgi:hypothetical protein